MDAAPTSLYQQEQRTQVTQAAPRLDGTPHKAVDPDQPSRNDVADMIEQLRALEQRDPTAFAESLADNIMDPEPVETEAFRSDDLVELSLVAAKYLQENAQIVLRRRRRGSMQQARTEGFLAKVNRERRVLESIAFGIRAKSGWLPNAPNPKKRAMQRLWNESLRGPIPEGRARELLREEEDKIRQQKRDQKKARQQAKKDAQAAERAEP